MTNNPYVRSQQPEHQQKRRVRYRRPKPFGTVQPNPKNEDAEDSPLNEAEKTDENKQAEETQTKPNVQIKTENEDEIKARPENEETEETKNEGVNKEPTPDKPAENQPEVELVKPAPAETPATVVPKNLINNEMYMALDRLMTYKMLHLLKRFAPVSSYIYYPSIELRSSFMVLCQSHPLPSAAFTSN